jgi:hypothetical protein
LNKTPTARSTSPAENTPARQIFYREIELFFGDLPH